jgi:hypothetical protein
MKSLSVLVTDGAKILREEVYVRVFKKCTFRDILHPIAL